MTDYDNCSRCGGPFVIDGKRDFAVVTDDQGAPTMICDKCQKSWQTFIAAVEQKRFQGAREYGSSSYQLPPEQLVQEVIDEVIDICGWSSILYHRLLDLKEALASPALANDRVPSERSPQS